LPTQAEDIAEYKREYAALGPDFHHDMTLVEYCGLRGMDHPREPQRGGQQQQQGKNIDFIQKLVNSPYLLLTDRPNALPELGYKS
jgi:glycerol-3-phosphate cytidylyltransferase-like family protein